MADERYTVDGRPLAFFHFSGFDPEHPLVLSRHQDRIDVAAASGARAVPRRSTPRESCDEGHAAAADWPYSFDALGDGTPLDARVRDLYDESPSEHGELSPSPFTPMAPRRS